MLTELLVLAGIVGATMLLRVGIYFWPNRDTVRDVPDWGARIGLRDARRFAEDMLIAHGVTGKRLFQCRAELSSAAKVPPIEDTDACEWKFYVPAYADGEPGKHAPLRLPITNTRGTTTIVVVPTPDDWPVPVDVVRH